MCARLPGPGAGAGGNRRHVKDASGAVLPGVTVEAASPVLIEKTRTVVSDGSGNYRIENLRPGSYTVTFTLTGFSTVKRDERRWCQGRLPTTADATLRVGAVAETITVTGETPLVDISSTKKEVVLDHDLDPEPAELATVLHAGAHRARHDRRRRRRRRERGIADVGTEPHRARQQGRRPAGDAERPQHHDAAGRRQHRRAAARRGLRGRNRRRHDVALRGDVRPAASASTSSRRTAATRSATRRSSPSRTSRCRGTTTPTR